MEKRIKYLLVALLCIMLFGTLTAAWITITLWLDTTGKLHLHLPSELSADITGWDWGVFDINETTGNLERTQQVIFTNLGTTPLQLSAYADMDSVFPAWFGSWWLTWSGEGYILEPFGMVTTTFTLTIDGILTGHDMEVLHIIEVDFGFDIIITAIEATVTYSLTIQSTTGGTTNPISGVYEYALGSSVAVQALGDAGYMFDHWILDVETRTENPTYVIMDADHTVTAYFEEVPTYSLSITTTTGGTTDPVPGSYNYPEGSSVIVTAIPDVSFVFDCWNLDGVNGTVNPISVLMDVDHSVTAYFEEAPPVETRVYVDPEYNSFEVGETFTITVLVADVEALWNWQIKICFNQTFLECTDAFVDPDSPFKFAMSPPSSIDNDEGYVMLGSTQLSGGPSEDGSGVLAVIEFYVKSEGVSDLNFDDALTYLKNSEMGLIPATLEDGYFDNT